MYTTEYWKETRAGAGTYPELAEKLIAMGSGQHPVGRWGGWIEIDGIGKPKMTVWWLSDRNSHCPLRGPAISFDIDSETGETSSFMHSVISMHWTSDPEERAEHMDDMKRRINKAFQVHQKRKPRAPKPRRISRFFLKMWRPFRWGML